MRQDSGFVKFINVVGQFLAFLTVILWLLCLLNTALSADGILGYHFLGEATAILEYIKYWATLITLALSGLEFASRNLLIMIIYLVIVAGCVVLLCFPGTFDSLVGMIQEKTAG